MLSGDNAPFDVHSDGNINLPRPAPPSSPELVFVKYNEEGDIKGAVKHIQGKFIIFSNLFLQVLLISCLFFWFLSLSLDPSPHPRINFPTHLHSDHYNEQHSKNVQDFNILGAEKKLGYNYEINPPLLRQEASENLRQIQDVPVDVHSDDNIELPRSDSSSPGLVFVKYNNEDDIKGTIEHIQSKFPCLVLLLFSPSPLFAPLFFTLFFSSSSILSSCTVEK